MWKAANTRIGLVFNLPQSGFAPPCARRLDLPPPATGGPPLGGLERRIGAQAAPDRGASSARLMPAKCALAM